MNFHCIFNGIFLIFSGFYSFGECLFNACESSPYLHISSSSGHHLDLGYLHCSSRRFFPLFHSVQILGPSCSDVKLRHLAANYVNTLPTAEIVLYLPFLATSLALEPFVNNELAKVLITRCWESKKMIISLFWHLKVTKSIVLPWF